MQRIKTIRNQCVNTTSNLIQILTSRFCFNILDILLLEHKATFVSHCYGDKFVTTLLELIVSLTEGRKCTEGREIIFIDALSKSLNFQNIS